MGIDKGLCLLMFTLLYICMVEQSNSPCIRQVLVSNQSKMLHLSPYIAQEGVVGHRCITSSTPVNSLVATIRILILLKLFVVKNFHCFTSLPSFPKNLLYNICIMPCLNMSLKKFTLNLYSCTVILTTFSL